MDEWHGEERRRPSKECMESMRKDVQNMRLDLDKLNRRFDEYLPALKDFTAGLAARRKVRDSIVQHSVTGIIWGVIWLIGVSVWSYVRAIIHTTPPGTGQ